MLTTIVFDFGGVLVEYNFRRFFSHILGSEEQGEFFLKNVFPAEVNADMDRGEHEPRYFIEQQQRLWPDYRQALDVFFTRYTDIFTREPDGMRQLMIDLKARGYRLLGLSNWSSKVYEVMKKFDIFELLDGYLLSKDVHQLKPEPEIYHSFLRKFNVKAEECVFIDDKPENIVGAYRIGMYGITFRSTAQLVHELEPLLLPYTFTPAQPQDEEAIWSIVHRAAMDMVSRGRHQWDDNYPQRDFVARDIRQGNGYVLRLDGNIVGYTAVTFDGEPSYNQLDGQWLTSGPYATIHRTAIDLAHRGRGLSRLLFIEAERLSRQHRMPSVRIDTNYDNVEMLHLVDSLGYKRCGLCYYDHGDEKVERIAFEKVL
ncbi:MAG: HAD-IA family hydrolase [Prevotella sp.]|nr:HAD-IA family hydrolase [Prevotella sp.]